MLLKCGEKPFPERTILQSCLSPSRGRDLVALVLIILSCSVEQNVRELDTQSVSSSSLHQANGCPLSLVFFHFDHHPLLSWHLGQSLLYTHLPRLHPLPTIQLYLPGLSNTARASGPDKVLSLTWHLLHWASSSLEDHCFQRLFHLLRSRKRLF